MPGPEPAINATRGFFLSEHPKLANSAPYEVLITGTDDETFLFAIPFENADGTAFPFGDYEIEYALSGSGQSVRLSQGSGITVSAPNVTFRSSGGFMSPGVYTHGCRVKHIASGDYTQVFDGTVTITEGNFR